MLPPWSVAARLGPALAVLVVSCRQTPAPGVDPPPAHSVPVAASPSTPVTELGVRPARELTWDYPATAAGPLRVVVAVPLQRGAEERFPVVVVLHGMGEAQKGPERGARGFIDDYWLPRAVQRLGAPPLSREDLLGMVTAARLDELNVSLARRPYRGLIVVCPYTPTTLRGADASAQARPYADFLVDDVLPRVRRETPALPSATATGIDGVSLGGRGALLVGLARPEAFGVVSTLQPAFEVSEAPALARRTAAVLREHPQLRFRLATSRRDYYLESTRAISAALRDRGIAVPVTVLEGPHNYDFNRGPGVFELLLFHDRALRGETAP